MADPWKFLSSKILQTCSIFTLRKEHYRSPRTGRGHDFFLIDSRDWVNMIALTPDSKVILVKQFRFGTRDFSLEIPGGMLEEGELPERAATRELGEETGFGGDEPHLLGFVHPNPAFQTNRCYTYLIRKCTPRSSVHQDATEEITEVQLTPLPEIPRLIREGKITHALVIAAFYWFLARDGVLEMK